jgi:hypothetical protein
VLFSGDLYLADHIKFFRSDENMGFQIESLKKVTNLDFNMLLCGHNPRRKTGENIFNPNLNSWKIFMVILFISGKKVFLKSRFSIN